MNTLKTETTTNYEQFKTLAANRPTRKQHVQKLIQSIEANGYIQDRPISVNEKGEIIDGQHRFEALKALGLPVPYVVVEGANEELALALNISNKSWVSADYLHYHASRGNKVYRQIEELHKEFPSYSLGSLLAIVTGYSRKGDGKLFREGNFPEFDYLKAHERLEAFDALNAIKPVFMLQTTVQAYLDALANPDFDPEVFYEALVSKHGLFTLQMRRGDNLREIEHLYNAHSGKRIRLL